MSPDKDLTVTDPFLKKNFLEPSFEKARAVGHQVASRVITHVRTVKKAYVPDATLEVQIKNLSFPVDNLFFRIAGLMGVFHRKNFFWLTVESEVNLVKVGPSWIATIPGEIYPEIVNGGTENPIGADFKSVPREVPPIREMMQGDVNFVVNLANDEVGYIIPYSQWDNQKPWLYNAEAETYGEINSLGPKTGMIVHKAMRELIYEGNR